MRLNLKRIKTKSYKTGENTTKQAKIVKGHRKMMSHHSIN